MKEIKTLDSVEIEGYNIKVVPFLTLAEQQMIVQTMLSTSNYLDQQAFLVVGVLYTCTDMLEKSDQEDSEEQIENKSTYTYEDIVYSGFWDELMKQCPYLQKAVHNIKKTVKYYQSTECALGKIAESCTSVLNKATETLNTLNEQIKQEDFMKNIMEKVSKTLK